MPDDPPPADAALRLDLLPSLPQSRTVRSLAPRLWRDGQVHALWLGGSFATGTADAYSDIDLRVAVPPADLERWEAPDLRTLLGASPLAQHVMRLGAEALLHHLVLANGDILDLLIQSAAAAPVAEATLVLGCRDAALAERLAASSHPPAQEDVAVTGDTVRDLIVALWVNSHKHRKVLHRQLDLMFPRRHRVQLADADAPLVHRRHGPRHQPPALHGHPRAHRAGAGRRGRLRQ